MKVKEREREGNIERKNKEKRKKRQSEKREKEKGDRERTNDITEEEISSYKMT